MKGPYSGGDFSMQKQETECRGVDASTVDGCGSGTLARPPARSYKETLKVECDTFTGRAPQRRAVSNSNESEQ